MKRKCAPLPEFFRNNKHLLLSNNRSKVKDTPIFLGLNNAGFLTNEVAKSIPVNGDFIRQFGNVPIQEDD